MPIEAQAAEVARVKRSRATWSSSPAACPRGASIREARELARRHNITGLLIEETRGSGVLAGLLSNRDMPWDAA